ncbi:hypothetical protein DICPUDRAFT_79023 [Dictyostelium purpureum]|uniref:Uncharacterized protein n=1 Tax=Dictyostelium purpureum TaxID=5786 RepID=F0ZLB5_DICPU|nr:uncharacterized protein DICPUDRAFT_79023 [Dictyostelium purpureum]EGC35275.1 hypothetical protein DICPUDRAFT_79023 [Dictyostelium purpureum]|eukprot:XP_003288201.1 hypothetical protein DICPUDRAFT_79023 [Dictyostelium purpureum]
MKINLKLIIFIVLIVLFNSCIIKGDILETDEIDGLHDECYNVKCPNPVLKNHCIWGHRPLGRYLDHQSTKGKGYKATLCCPICLIENETFCNHSSKGESDPNLKYLSGIVYICPQGNTDCNLKTNQCEVIPEYMHA